MKKAFSILLCFVMVLCFSACSVTGGNTENVTIKTVESNIYAQEDIEDAIQTILNEFKNWKGCTLTEIYYAGDKMALDYQDWADRKSADEVIVLLSSFDVDSSGGDGSLNPNSTYDNWMWILVRNKGESWKHVDHGY